MQSLIDEVRDHLERGIELDVRGHPLEHRQLVGRDLAAILKTTSTPKGMHVRGLDVVGTVNIGATSFDFPIEMHDCTFSGDVIVTKAHLRSLSLRGSTLRRLRANHSRIDLTLNIGEGFVSRRRTQMYAAEIGSLHAANALFLNKSGHALDAEFASIGKYCNFSRSVFNGTVNLLRAHIGDQLDLSHSRIAHSVSNLDAINFDGLRLGGSLLLTGCQLEGRLWLASATIDQQLALDGLSIRATASQSIEGAYASAQAIFATKSLIVGPIHLFGLQAQIVDLSGSTFTASPGTDFLIDLGGAQITTRLILAGAKVDGKIDLSSAQIGILATDTASWAHRIAIQGTTYSLPADDAVSVTTRLASLTRDEQYSPQAFKQLRSAYLENGDRRSARIVGIAQERTRYRSSSRLVRPFAALWSGLLRIVIGYGYAPHRAVISLVALLAIAATLEQIGFANGLIIARASQTLEDFSPIRYAASVIFPVLNLRSGAGYVTRGWISWINFATSVLGYLYAAVIAVTIAGFFRET